MVKAGDQCHADFIYDQLFVRHQTMCKVSQREFASVKPILRIKLNEPTTEAAWTTRKGLFSELCRGFLLFWLLSFVARRVWHVEPQAIVTFTSTRQAFVISQGNIFLLRILMLHHVCL